MKKVGAAKKWARARKESDKSRNGISVNGPRGGYDARATHQIESLIAAEDWTRARSLIRRELTKSPSHWLLTMLGLTYYEQKQYEKALVYSKKALRSNPNCPLVLAHYAGVLDMLGRPKKALKVYQSLLDRDVESVAFDPCGEGMDWALRLLNDCHYRMARCSRDLRDDGAARASLKKYLHNRAHGVGSIYQRTKAEAMLASLSS